MSDDEKRVMYKTPSSILLDAGSTKNGTAEIMELFEGKKIFDYPKPSTLLTRLLQYGYTNRSDIVLDFFSGSATTAHAVMQLNAEDGGNRRFIMVQLPEVCDEKSEAFKAGYKTICEIGKERIRRAGKKIKEENATNAPNLDMGFRVFKVDSSNMKDVYYTPDALEQSQLDLFADAIKEDRTAEDLLFQVFLDCGLDLSLPVAKETVEGHVVYAVDGNAMVACFTSDVSEPLIRALAKRQPLKAVFLDRSFGKDSIKLNVTQIFKQLSPITDVKTI
jgi:adenine-specific DNA-methyltransferase